MLLTTNIFAQKVSLSYQNVPFEQVLKAISSQTGMSLIFSDQLVDLSRKVSVNAEQKEVREVLDELLSGTDLDYEINNNKLYLVKRSSARPSSDRQESAERRKQQIKGVVVDNQGVPVIAASVVEKGVQGNGTITDINGNFTITVNSGAVLEFSSLGYATVEVASTSGTPMHVMMREDNQVLDEIVVTALGIKKEKKALGYSVQEVKGDALVQVPSSNLMSNLTGKVAGLTIFNKQGTFDAPDIKIRGSKNILIVVDGVPGYDSWSINPENIESVDVIKGATGAALYGAQGSDGVLMITTKRGGDKGRGVTIDLSSNTMFQGGYLVIPEYQTSYGQGMNGKYSYKNGLGAGIFDNEFKSWGPKLNVKDPETDSGYVEYPQYNSPVDPNTGELVPLPWVTRSWNPIKEFLRPSLTTNNTVSVGGNNDLGHFRLSLNQIYKKGQAPNTDLINNNVQISGGYKFHEKISVDASVGFNNLNSDNYETSNYNWQNYMLIIGHDFPANVSMNDLRKYWVEGKEGYKQRTWVENRNNPYWQLHERTQWYDRNKIVGWVKATVDFTDYLSLMGRANLAYTNTNTEYRENIGNNMIGTDSNGAFSKTEGNNLDMNYDFLLSFDKRFANDKFGVDASCGGSSRRLTNDSLDSSIDGLILPGLFNLSNRVGEIKASNDRTKKIVNSLYFTGTIDYARAVYLTVTARNDWSSSLSLNHNSYFYPSVSFSTIINEIVKLPKFITFAKFRASWARGRQDTDPYWNSAVYTINSFTPNNTPMASYPSTLYADDLMAQRQDSYEIGADLRFFNNRLGFDFAYFRKSVTDMITTVPLSLASGYSKRQINGREIVTKGYELAINGKPIETTSFTWSSQINLGLWKDYLWKLAPGETKYLGFYREKERIGTWRGRVFERSSNGNILYENGLPVWATKNQRGGFLDPDLTFSFINNFRYRNWQASVQIDGRLGGFIYNYQHSTMMLRGTALESAVEGRRENPWIGNGDKVISGEVIKDAYGNVVYDDRKYVPNDVPVKYYDWVQKYYGGVFEVNMYDNTFVKLREINIGYNFKFDWLRNVLKVNNLYVAIIGQNLWLYTNVPYTDPDKGSSDNGQGPSPRMFGFNVKLSF